MAKLSVRLPMVVGVFALATWTSAWAACDAAGADAAAIVAGREAIDHACPCGSAASRRDYRRYRRCATGVVDARVAARALPRDCRRQTLKHAKQSFRDGDCHSDVWLFGDSITVLYCDDLKAAHPEWTVTCLGVSGETTTDGLPRLVAELTRRPRPRVVVVEEGINDVAQATLMGSCDPEVSSALDNLQAMAHLGPVLFTTTVYRGCPITVEDPDIACYAEGACRLDLALRSWGAIDISLDVEEFVDFVHPNATGQRRIAAVVADAIAAVLP